MGREIKNIDGLVLCERPRNKGGAHGLVRFKNGKAGCRAKYKSYGKQKQQKKLYRFIFHESVSCKGIRMGQASRTRCRAAYTDGSQTYTFMA